MKKNLYISLLCGVMCMCGGPRMESEPDSEDVRRSALTAEQMFAEISDLRQEFAKNTLYFPEDVPTIPPGADDIQKEVINLRKRIETYKKLKSESNFTDRKWEELLNKNMPTIQYLRESYSELKRKVRAWTDSKLDSRDLASIKELVDQLNVIDANDLSKLICVQVSFRENVDIQQSGLGKLKQEAARLEAKFSQKSKHDEPICLDAARKLIQGNMPKLPIIVTSFKKDKDLNAYIKRLTDLEVPELADILHLRNSYLGLKYKAEQHRYELERMGGKEDLVYTTDDDAIDVDEKNITFTNGEVINSDIERMKSEMQGRMDNTIDAIEKACQRVRFNNAISDDHRFGYLSQLDQIRTELDSKQGSFNNFLSVLGQDLKKELSLPGASIVFEAVIASLAQFIEQKNKELEHIKAEHPGTLASADPTEKQMSQKGDTTKGMPSGRFNFKPAERNPGTSSGTAQSKSIKTK